MQRYTFRLLFDILKYFPESYLPIHNTVLLNHSACGKLGQLSSCPPLQQTWLLRQGLQPHHDKSPEMWYSFLDFYSRNWFCLINSKIAHIIIVERKKITNFFYLFLAMFCSTNNKHNNTFRARFSVGISEKQLVSVSSESNRIWNV